LPLAKLYFSWVWVQKELKLKNFPIETPTCDFRFKILSMENSINFLSNQNLLNTSSIYDCWLPPLHGWKWIFLKITTRGLGGCWRPPSRSKIWGFQDHPEMKIFTLFWGIKVVMSTSNFMIFQGAEYYKTGNATNTLDCFPIMHVSALFQKTKSWATRTLLNTGDEANIQYQ
jgi:hypothetical protein